jgi:RimJ/RimL family protein N-acetyltransferase
MIPYRILTPRLLLRCWNPADAPLLKAAVDANLEHLRPWMPWAWADPEPLEDKVALLRRFRSAFDRAEDYTFGVFSPQGDRVLGGTGLHDRVGPDGLEIGYWIDAAHGGRGLATEAAAALTRVVFEHTSRDRIEIRCNPANAASAAVPRKLGFRLEATLDRRLRERDGALHPVQVWSLFRADYPGSPAAGTALEAFDALDRPLPPPAKA